MGFWLAAGGDRVPGGRRPVHHRDRAPGGLPPPAATSQGSTQTRKKPQMRFDYLRELHDFLQWRTGDGILLAEANILPKENLNYFGPEGDRMHMILNFQVNQTMFYALASGDCRPLMKALDTTRKRPELSQWGIFLRSHDELDLGRLTETQRQTVFQQFGPEPDDAAVRPGHSPAAGQHGGRRSAPAGAGGQPDLLDARDAGHALRRRDRHGRRPDAARPQGGAHADAVDAATNTAASPPPSGSSCRPSPSGPFGYQQVNVADQRRDPGSLLNLYERFIRTRKECPEFGWGDHQELATGSHNVLAVRCEWRNNAVLSVHNFGSRGPRGDACRSPGPRTCRSPTCWNPTTAPPHPERPAPDHPAPVRLPMVPRGPADRRGDARAPVVQSKWESRSRRRCCQRGLDVAAGRRHVVAPPEGGAMWIQNAMSILITGATGKQGGAVARHLLAEGARIRAVTRKPESPAARALASQGAEVVAADFEDEAAMTRAMQGVWGMFAVQNTWESGRRAVKSARASWMRRARAQGGRAALRVHVGRLRPAQHRHPALRQQVAGGTDRARPEVPLAPHPAPGVLHGELPATIVRPAPGQADHRPAPGSATADDRGGRRGQIRRPGLPARHRDGRPGTGHCRRLADRPPGRRRPERRAGPQHQLRAAAAGTGARVQPGVRHHARVVRQGRLQRRHRGQRPSLRHQADAPARVGGGATEGRWASSGRTEPITTPSRSC